LSGKQWDFAGLDTNRIESGSARQIRIESGFQRDLCFLFCFPRAAKRQRGPKRPAHSRMPAARSLLHDMLR
jgi:hypothetical protein